MERIEIFAFSKDIKLNLILKNNKRIQRIVFKVSETFFD